MHPTTARPTITVTTDGVGVVSHVGSRLLAGLADRSGLTEAFSDALAPLRERRAGHDPGRVMTDLAVLLADGGRTISDLAVLRDQRALFGPVASTATAWRVLDKIGPAMLNRLRAARAVAREQLWAQRAEAVGPIGGHRAGGRTWPGLRLTSATRKNVRARVASCAVNIAACPLPLRALDSPASHPRRGRPRLSVLCQEQSWRASTRPRRGSCRPGGEII